MKTCGGAVAYLHAFLISVPDGCEWSTSSVSRFIPGGMIPLHPLDKTLGRPQSRSGGCEEEKNIYPRQESKPDSSVIQSVA
jgi:hypothetical protein